MGAFVVSRCASGNDRVGLWCGGLEGKKERGVLVLVSGQRAQTRVANCGIRQGVNRITCLSHQRVDHRVSIVTLHPHDLPSHTNHIKSRSSSSSSSSSSSPSLFLPNVPRRILSILTNSNPNPIHEILSSQLLQPTHNNNNNNHHHHLDRIFLAYATAPSPLDLSPVGVVQLVTMPYPFSSAASSPSPHQQQLGDDDNALVAGYLANVYVLREARRCGVATCLLQAAESFAVSHCMSHLFLRVHSNNTTARAFYAKHRFHTVAIERLTWKKHILRLTPPSAILSKPLKTRTF